MPVRIVLTMNPLMVTRHLSNSSFRKTIFFSSFSPPFQYRHLSHRIDYAKIIFFNNQQIDSGAHPIHEEVVGSVATSWWITRRQWAQRGNFSSWRERNVSSCSWTCNSTDSREGSSREKKKKKGKGVPSARHCAPLNCSHCDPRVLQIPIRALWPGINPFP